MIDRDAEEDMQKLARSYLGSSSLLETLEKGNIRSVSKMKDLAKATEPFSVSVV